MRILWTFCALVVAAAGGVYWSLNAPESMLGRLVSRCCSGARTSSTTYRTCGCQIIEDAPLDEIPSDPTPIEEPLNVAAASNIDPVSPPPIVISEDELPSGPVAIETVDLAIYKGPAAPAEGPACPLTMAYCEEDLPPMAFVGEGEESEADADSARVENDEKSEGEDCSDAECAIHEAVAPRCEESRHYHEHYSGCPATGSCPYSGCYGADRHNLIPPPVKSPEPKSEVGQTEESEEPPHDSTDETPGPQSHKSLKPNDNATDSWQGASPEVDTMEYRRSDGNLGEFGPGPV